MQDKLDEEEECESEYFRTWDHYVGDGHWNGICWVPDKREEFCDDIFDNDFDDDDLYDDPFFFGDDADLLF